MSAKKPLQMKERVWHKGPPPHVGWWNASSYNRTPDVWRWFDGENWSLPIQIRDEQVDTDLNVEAVAEWKSYMQESVEWTHYYPKNARVPRVAP